MLDEQRATISRLSKATGRQSALRWYMCALEVRYRSDQRAFVHPTAYHMPPRATVIASPLTAPAASLHRNAITCATSRGSRTRFCG